EGGEEPAGGTACVGGRGARYRGHVRGAQERAAPCTCPQARTHPTVVGIFHYGNRHNLVVPMDDKITHEIVIPRGMERPENSPEQAEGGQQPSAHPGRPAKPTVHRVVGGEARRTQSYDDLEGMIVDVEIVDWPTATQSPRG